MGVGHSRQPPNTPAGLHRTWNRLINAWINLRRSLDPPVLPPPTVSSLPLLGGAPEALLISCSISSCAANAREESGWVRDLSILSASLSVFVSTAPLAPLPSVGVLVAASTGAAAFLSPWLWLVLVESELPVEISPAIS